MASKRKAPPLSDHPTKVKKQEAHVCPNVSCARDFLTSRRLKIHLTKSTTCSDALLLPVHNKASQSDMTEEDEYSETEYLCDDTDDDDTKPWACLEPWDNSSDDDDSTSDEENTSDKPADDKESTSDKPDDTADDNELVTPDGLCFTTPDFVETKLLKLMDDAHAPHFLYQDVLNWAKEAKQSGYDFRPKRTTRRAQIKHVEKLAQLQYCRPETIRLTLPGDGVVVPVTRFPFINMLYSLLSDSELVGDLSNLDVNPENPFGKYQSEGDYLTTVNSGAWYQTAYKNLIKDPEKDFLLPIVFACDETKLSKTGKTGCWPLLFTTTLFNQKLRNKASAWRPLGYVYDINIVDSKQERAHQSNEYKGERLHAVFRTLLESFIEAQNEGLLDNVTVTLGGQQRIVNLRIPVVFIIGDMQGGDKICCSSAGYSNKMNRLCRKCNVRGDQSGDPFVECKRMSMIKIQELVTTNNVDALKAINQHNVHSAWFDVGYGGCRFGIFSAACPVEALHALENGLIPDVLQVLFTADMTPAQLGRLDQLAKNLSALARQKYLSSGAEPLMPRLRWSDGISSLSDMPAKYKVGILFTIVVLTLQDDGLEFFTKVLKTPKRVSQMRQVFQMILSYWMWLKKDKYWKRGDKVAKNIARVAIRTMLVELMKLWPRDKGQGWEKAKIHEQLHVPDDIERNGAPQGWHSGPTENNHISSFKNYASQTNRRRENLDAQIGARNAESFMINSAYQKMTTAYSVEDENTSASIDSVFTGVARTASKACIFIYKEKRGMEIGEPYWLGSDQGPIHPWVSMFLKEHFASLPSSPQPDLSPESPRLAYNCARLSTEYTRQGESFRASPNFRGGGPWYDWAMFRWAKEGSGPKNRSKADSCVHYGDNEEMRNRYTYAPGLILGVLNGPHPQPKPDLIVLCCDSSYSKSSVFSTHWKVAYNDKAMKHPMICLVSPDAIVRHCLMIPENNDWNGFHEIWARERWGPEFCTV
jgi:hypothetical protein